MGNIVLLDELTINKIAAGEVIERPASAVKELVENSIDAGAKHITIEIKNGGISFIRITDDGKGIQKDDVEMAFERHATSKIRSADDLQEVKSMGFRGEALASIAAISNVELVSRQETDEIGTRIVVEGGKVLSVDEIGCAKGTTITIRNLFFNTPVRYKFLKKDFTESGYIEDVVTRIALINPDVSIKYINTGKSVISTNGSGNIRDAIYNIFGKEVTNNLIDVDYEFEYIRVKGVIGTPSISRANRSNQIFFVNNRYVKDKTLSSAVEQAYKGIMPFGKFPFLVLNIEMTPSKVDVNVHPAKLEVRFAEESIVFKAVYHAIKDSLVKQNISNESQKVDENQIEVSTFVKEDLKKKEKEEDNTKQINTPITAKLEYSNEDVFNKLKLLQEELKKEVEDNPNIQLTDEYKKMTEQFNSSINNEVTSSTEINEQINEGTNSVQEDEIKTEENENQDLVEKELTQQNESEIEENKQQNSENDVNEYNTNENQSLEEQKLETNNQEIIEDENIESISPEETIKENIEVDEEVQQEDQNSELSFRQMYKKLFGKEPYGGRIVEAPKENDNIYEINDDDFSQDNMSIFEDEEQYNKPDYNYIGSAFDSYVIIEMKNELFIMDQKLANERIMSEKIKNNFENSENKSSQMLLLPDVISLDTKQMNIVKDNTKLFEKAGFTLEEFGENTIKLIGVPEICVDLNTEELFKEVLEEINQAPRNDEGQKEEKFIDAISSRVASKMPVNKSKEDIEGLIDELLSLNNPFINTKGNPIVIKMSRYEIERKFARK